MLGRLNFVETTGSTNADLLADAGAREGDWLIARWQSEGRGRQGRQWHSLDGNFLGSTLVQLRADDPPAASLSLLAGLALVEALQGIDPPVAATLKWPNDVLVDEAKLAGILLERAGERVVAGFGVNLAAAPDLADRPTVALGGRIAAHGFAPLLAGAFGRLLREWRRLGTGWLVEAWQEKALPVGTPLTVHEAPGVRISGAFAGIEPDGAMRLDTADGLRVIRAGDVTLANPAAGR